MQQIGITERGDASLDLQWTKWVLSDNPAILITKSPLELYRRLGMLAEEHGVGSLNVLTHCTVTGWGGTALEPRVPSPEIALLGYGNLIALLGRERVTLRIDPIIATEDSLRRAREVLRRAHETYPPGTRVRISFLDMYPHVRERFLQAGIPIPHESFHAPIATRLLYWEELGKPEVCGEPGMECTGCISPLDCEVLGVIPEGGQSQQRRACACLAQKRELLSRKGRCGFLCPYCYWKD
jgi:hypothetical protein